MKKVLIDHKNLCFRVVDMDDIEKRLYSNNGIEISTISDILTTFEVQKLTARGYKEL